jgi:N-acetylmuramoyl-L-alanine amidase
VENAVRAPGPPVKRHRPGRIGAIDAATMRHRPSGARHTPQPVLLSTFFVAAAAAAAPLASTDMAPAPATARSEIIGRSARGRPIRALRVGSPRARVKILVVGTVHGNEQAGTAVVDRLRRVKPPRGTALWLIEDANPDGSAAGSRHNANGVDLNRNFPYRWRHQDGVYESGPGPASEPETQAMQRFVRRERPRVTLWYHQALRMVVKSAGDPVLERLISRRTGLPRRRLPAYHGTATSWQNSTFGGDSAFVVELAAGPLPPAGVRRHVRAIRSIARSLAPPRIVRKPIPYGAGRKADMRAYARRHYGIDDHRLRDPKVIVQHYTVTDSFPPVYNTFAPNRPDAELGELPGVCSHYVIDRDGTIYQLVSTRIMCRHTVGLNWTSIGIEHVGRSDAQVLGNRRQMAASLRLTRMLQGRHQIATRNVIGHNENRDSPFHRERVARLRSQTHADFPKAAMDSYRRRLERLPAPASIR